MAKSLYKGIEAQATEVQNAQNRAKSPRSEKGIKICLPQKLQKPQNLASTTQVFASKI